MPHEIPVSILLGYEFRMPLSLSSQKKYGRWLNAIAPKTQTSIRKLCAVLIHFAGQAIRSAGHGAAGTFGFRPLLGQGLGGCALHAPARPPVAGVETGPVLGWLQLMNWLRLIGVVDMCRKLSLGGFKNAFGALVLELLINHVFWVIPRLEGQIWSILRRFSSNTR
jgi:hypothetical protein